MRNPRPWIIQRRLAEAAQKLLAKIYVWLQITVFTENDERRLARIGEDSILNQTKQPIGQIGRKISVETQTAFPGLYPHPPDMLNPFIHGNRPCNERKSRTVTILVPA